MMRRRTHTTGRGALAFAATALLVLTACGDADPGGAVVRDSAGIQIVENGPRALEHAARWTVADSPRLRIGAPDSASFREIGDALRRADGAIVVSDGGTRLVHAFDSTGAPLWRQEGGPDTRFRQPRDLWRVAGDTVAVLDPAAQRLTVLGPDGAVVRSAELDATLRPGNPDATAPLGAAGGRLFVAGPASGMDSAGVEMERQYLVDAGTGELRELGEYGRMPRVEVPGQRPAWPRFGWARHLAMSEDGLYTGTGERYEVALHDEDHQTKRLIRWSGPDRDIREEDLEEYFQGYLARVGSSHGQEEQLRAVLADIPVAERKPAYFGLLTDRVGNLWVRDLDLGWMRPPETLRWTVFDGEGKLIARAELPGGVLPLEIGEDWVLARVAAGDEAYAVALFDLIR